MLINGVRNIQIKMRIDWLDDEEVFMKIKQFKTEKKQREGKIKIKRIYS